MAMVVGLGGGGGGNGASEDEKGDDVEGKKK